MISAIVVMGVSGSGKTVIGTLLAERLHWCFADADDFHPPENIAKMRSGQPLTDADRVPWLRAIGDWLSRQAAAGEPAVVTCSALKRQYRDLLRRHCAALGFVYLKGDTALIQRRLSARPGHFMPVALLGSQISVLEEPEADENAITVSIAPSLEHIVDDIIIRLAEFDIAPAK